MSTRKKTTISIDADLLRLTKIAAAREDKAEYQVIEEALTEHLLKGVLDRIWAGADLSEDEATSLAVEEVRAVRRGRTRNRKT